MAQDLKLQVLLNAVDKATGPLKKIGNASGHTAQALKANRDNLKGLKTAQKDLGSFRNLKRQSETTAGALHQEEQRIAELNQQIKAATGPTKRLTQSRDKAIRSARKLKGQHAAQQRELQGLRDKLGRVKGLTGTLSDKEGQLAKRIAATNHKISRQQAALKKLGQADISGKFRNMTGQVRRFGRRATLALGAAGGAIFGLAHSTAGLGDTLDKQSKALGMTTQSIQELQYAAEMGGLSTDQLDASLERYTRRLDRAAKGKGAAKDAYKALGLDPKALMKMNPSQQFDAIADAIAGVDDKQKQLSLTTDLFGRRAGKMVNVLALGSDGLKQMRKQAHETGYILGNAAVKNSDAFAGAQIRARLALAGVKNTIGAQLMPVVTDLMQKLTHWLTTNHDQVVAFAKAFGEQLKDAVPSVLAFAKGVGRMAQTFGQIISKTAELVGGFDNLAMILAGLVALKPAAAILSFGGALLKAGSAVVSLTGALPAVAGGIKAIGVALAANPIGLAITAVAGAAFLIYKYWGPISDFFKALWGGIQSIFASAGDWLAGMAAGMTQPFTAAWQRIKAAFAGGIKGVAALLADWSPLGLIYKAIQSVLATLGVELPDNLSAAFSQAIGAVYGLIRNWHPLQAIKNLIVEGIPDLIKALLSAFKGVGKAIVRGIIEGIQSLPGAIGGAIKDAAGGALSAGADIAKGAASGIADGAQAVGSATAGVAHSAVSGFKGLLGIHSPSRVFQQLGGFVVQGLERGIGRREHRAVDQVRRLSRNIKAAGSGALLGAGVATTASAMPGPKAAQPTALRVDTPTLAAPAIRDPQLRVPELPMLQARVPELSAPELPRLAVDTAALDAIAIDRRPVLAAPGRAPSKSDVHVNFSGDVHITNGLDEQAFMRRVEAAVTEALTQRDRDARATRVSALYDTE